MCGINGLVERHATTLRVAEKLEAMNRCIIHRGPDDEGFFTANIGQSALGFGMRRLSVIDLRTGDQPMYTDDRSKVLVFNGEIYNYKSLKHELEEKGVLFHTTSDTEVILRLYEYYGSSAFKKLDGMFVFSLYDRTLNKLFIARDYFGEKPLYYRHSDSGLMWSSELKSMTAVLNARPAIDPTGLALFFQLTYIPAPFTIYKGIFKLEANHVLEYDPVNNTMTLEKTATEKKPGKKDVSFGEAKAKIHDLVRESVLSRSVSDVPIGTFLSGGVDSSIVSLCLAQGSAHKINTFSIGFEKRSFNETQKAQTVARLIGSHHHEFILSEKDLSADLDKILLNFDEPFADSSALPTYLVAEKTSGHVKVALTGDGGDEVFGGYNKYLIGHINKRYTGIVPQALHRGILKVADVFTKQKEDHRGLKFKIKKSLYSIDYGNDFFYNIIKLGFSDQDMTQYFLPGILDENPLHYFQSQIPSPTKLSDFKEVDKRVSLEGDILVKVDRTSMLASLECRAPFLNRALWEYTGGLPENYLIKGNEKKYLLKKAFEPYFPPHFLKQSKQGFGVPVGDWLKMGIRKELESYIEAGFLEKQGLFDTARIGAMVKNHLSSLEDHSFKVWTFYCFQKWYRHNIL